MHVSRVPRTRAEARVSYDRLSSWYDWLEAPFERAARRAGLRLLAVRSGEQVLEVGAGTGQDLVALARAAGPTGRVLAVDQAPGMNRQEQARLARAGLRAHAHVVQADALALPLPAACVDAILMSFVLELFDTPELVPALEQCRRVLRPGGRIVVVSLAARRRPQPMERLYLWAHAQWPRLVDCRPIYVVGTLRAAGFRVTRGERWSLFGLPVAVVRAEPGAGEGGQTRDIPRVSMPEKPEGAPTQPLGGS